MNLADSVKAAWAYLTAGERRVIEAKREKVKPKPKGAPVPKGWRSRVKTIFPRFTKYPFVDRHEQFWEYIEAQIPEGPRPRPFTAFWARGGAKSTSAEMAVVDLGVRNIRPYCLYVRMTQAQADKSVSNIATMLESAEIKKYYPEHADRKLNKYGSSRGWRREQIKTSGGFTVDALGLDTASRGAKVDENRPGIIVFDDIDDALDSQATTLKKVEIITKSILPTGAENVIVIFIQNLILPNGVAAMLSDDRADFMTGRIRSGPFPAVRGLKTEWRVIDEETQERRCIITGGTATWEGQNLQVCEDNINLWGLSAFLKEAQHEVFGRARGIVLRFDRDRHLIDMTDEEAREAIKLGAVFGGVDFGAWRFAFTLYLVDRNGLLTHIDEYFAQRREGEASLLERAKAIHELCAHYGIIDRMIPIWGDAANPQDILEINLRFKEGWKDEHGRIIKSKLRVVAVGMENKNRKVAVERWNNALDHNLVRYRRDVALEGAWYMGATVEKEGTLITKTSRTIWEMENWSYLAPKPGEEQDQDPSDATADGADEVAASRYALMSHWKPAKTPKVWPTISGDTGREVDYRKGKLIPHKHAADELEEMAVASNTRVRRTVMPNPRKR